MASGRPSLELLRHFRDQRKVGMLSHSKIAEGSSDEVTLRHVPEKKDVEIFYWKIPSFKDLYASSKTPKAKSSASKQLCRFPFNAGKTLGIPSKWEFNLQIKSKSLAAELKFFGADTCRASYSLLLKPGNGEYDCVISDMNWYPRSSHSEDISRCFYKFETLEELQKGGFLSNGELQIQLQVTLSIEETLFSATEAKFKRDLSWDLKTALETGMGADVTFIFEEEGSENNIGKISAHRTILSLRSPVFASMFGSGMKEAANGEVKIEDITENAFGILLKFIYSGEVDEEWGSVADELIYAADKYDLKILQNYLCENIDPVLTVRNVWRIRVLAKLHEFPQVLNSTTKFVKENVEEFLDNIHDIILG